MSENSERLTDLEMKFMDQNQLLEQLSDEVALCHRRLDELVRDNNNMKEMMKSFEPESEVSPDE